MSKTVGLSNEEISVVVNGYWNHRPESMIAEFVRLNERTPMDLARDIYKAAPGQRIMNVKSLRERTGLGLKEALDMIIQAEVEDLEKRLLDIVTARRDVVLTTFQTINPNLVEPPF